jgi:hypothetical protein
MLEKRSSNATPLEVTRQDVPVSKIRGHNLCYISRVYARVVNESDLSNEDKYQIHQLENLVYFPDLVLHL